MGETINIMEYLDIFKKRKKIVFIILFIFMLAGGLLQYRHSKSYVPTYSSTVSVRINTNKKAEEQSKEAKKEAQKQKEEENSDDKNDEKANDEQQNEEEQNLTNQDTQGAPIYSGPSMETSALNQSISEKYSSVAVSKRPMMELIDKLGLQGTPQTVSANIAVVPQENLMEFIDITVTDTDPNQAQKIANAMPEVFNNEIERIIGLDCVQVIYDASEPIQNPKPADNTFRNFAIIGVVLAIFMVLLLECLDNKVVTPDDAEKYWGLPVIGVIPFDKEQSKGKKVKAKEVNTKGVNTKEVNSKEIKAY